MGKKGKGKGGKKEKKPAVDPEKGMNEAKAFIRDFPEACKTLGVEPLALPLDRGEEGTGPFLRLAVHRGCAAVFAPQHMRALAIALQPYSFLQRLCLWSVPLRDQGCKDLGQYVAQNRTVLSLEATDCGVTTLGCKHIGEALERNATLQSLKLDHNQALGADGVQLLGESLRLNRGLQQLSLTFCGLEGETGAMPISTQLLHAPTLRVLELKGNRFGHEGVAMVVRALKTCASLFRIDLADTGFATHAEVHGAFEECFEQNTTCHEYALAGNPIGDTTAYRWLGMVRRLPHLIYLDVTNNLDPILFKQIGDATASNKKDWLKRQKSKGKKGGKKKK